MVRSGDQPVEEVGNIEIIDVSDYRPARIPSKKWRECIKKMYEVDPLCCPKCGSEMKINSFITDFPVIRKILEHLDLWEQEASREPTKQKPFQENNEIIYEPFDDGCPEYEEPYIVLN